MLSSVCEGLRFDQWAYEQDNAAQVAVSMHLHSYTIMPAGLHLVRACNVIAEKGLQLHPHLHGAPALGSPAMFVL